MSRTFCINDQTYTVIETSDSKVPIDVCVYNMVKCIIEHYGLPNDPSGN